MSDDPRWTPETRDLAAAAVHGPGCDHPGADSCEPWWIADRILTALADAGHLTPPTSPLEPVPSTPRVLGYVVATKGADGFWHDDWDGKVHGDLATGRAALAECRDFGCESTLAELREVEETNDAD